MGLKGEMKKIVTIS